MNQRARAVLVASALAVLAGCAHAKYRPHGNPVPYDGYFATYPSGLRLVVVTVPNLERFTLVASYRAGSVDDPEGKEGLAHLVEHLAFRAVPVPGAPRIWDRLVSSGRAFNAFTTNDHTEYWQQGRPGELDGALRLEAARLRAPLAGIDEDTFRIERDVVTNEWRESFDTDAIGAELQWVRELAWPGHAYSRPTAGTPRSLASVKLEDAHAFARARYAPENVVLVVVGPWNAKETAARVVDALGELVGDGKAPVKPVAHAPPPLPAGPRDAPLVTRKAPVERPHLWIAWPVPGEYAHKQPVELTAVARLELMLRFELAASGLDERVDRVRAGMLPADGGSLLVVGVDLQRAEDADRVLEQVKTAAFRVRADDGLRSTFVPRIRDLLLVRSYLSLEELDAPGIAQFLRATGSPDYLAGWSRLVAVQLSREVGVFDAEHLTRDRAVSLLVVPDGNPPFPAAAEPAREERLEALDDGSDLPPPDADEVARVAVAPGLDRAARRVLANGLEVVIVKKGSIPAAQVELVVRTSSEGTPQNPAALPRLALMGAGDRWSATDEILVGGWSYDSAGREHVVHGIHGSSANIAVLLDAVAGWARRARIDSFPRRRHALERRVDAEAQLVLERADRLLRARLYPRHAYAAAPTAESVEQIEEGVARRWLSEELRPERSTLVVVSDLAPTPELWDAVADSFGGWPRGPDRPPLRATAPSPPAARSVVVLDRPGASQALLLVGWQGPPLAKRDEAAHDAVRELLEGRIMRRLRVQQGVTYGVRMRHAEHATASALVARLAVERDAAPGALRDTLAALASVADAGITDAEAGRARWQVARAYAYRFETVRGTSSALSWMAQQSLAPDHLERLAPSIASLDAGRLRAAARELGPGREAIVVVGDAQVLVPKLRAAGFEAELAKEVDRSSPPERVTSTADSSHAQ